MRRGAILLHVAHGRVFVGALVTQAGADLVGLGLKFVLVGHVFALPVPAFVMDAMLEHFDLNIEIVQLRALDLHLADLLAGVGAVALGVRHRLSERGGGADDENGREAGDEAN